MRKVLLFGFILLLPFVFGLTVEDGTIFNTSISNSPVNFSSSFNITNISVESSYVYLYNVSSVNSTGDYECGDINHSTENSVLSSSDFNCTLNSTVEEVDPEVINSGSSNSYINQKSSENSIRMYVRVDRRKQ